MVTQKNYQGVLGIQLSVPPQFSINSTLKKEREIKRDDWYRWLWKAKTSFMRSSTSKRDQHIWLVE